MNKNYDKYNNAINEYYYEDEKYLVFIKNDTIAVQQKNRVHAIHTDESNIIFQWSKANGLENSIEFESIILPIVNLFEIPDKGRTELYKKYKESTIAKLEIAIAELNNILDNYQLKHLIYEQQFLEARRNGYNAKLKWFNDGSERAGHNKFLHLILKPLFDKLKDHTKIKNTRYLIIIDLFIRFNFDGYKDMYEDISEDGIDKMKTILK